MNNIKFYCSASFLLSLLHDSRSLSLFFFRSLLSNSTFWCSMLTLYFLVYLFIFLNPCFGHSFDDKCIFIFLNNFTLELLFVWKFLQGSWRTISSLILFLRHIAFLHHLTWSLPFSSLSFCNLWAVCMEHPICLMLYLLNIWKKPIDFYASWVVVVSTLVLCVHS